MMIEGVQQLLLFSLHLSQGCKISLTRVELEKKLSGHKLAANTNRGDEGARRVERGGRRSSNVNSVCKVRPGQDLNNPDPINGGSVITENSTKKSFTAAVESGKICSDHMDFINNN